jgi:hypothetical protein
MAKIAINIIGEKSNDFLGGRLDENPVELPSES